MNRPTSQSGQMLLYAILMMAVMLAISLALTSLFVSKLRAAQSARDTVIAFYAADSASETCLYQARIGPTDPVTMDNGATFTIIDAADDSDITADCSVLGSGSFTFQAIGAYRGTSRALEISQ
jgi:Tfp pilus assembly protein PilX